MAEKTNEVVLRRMPGGKRETLIRGTEGYVRGRVELMLSDQNYGQDRKKCTIKPMIDKTRSDGAWIAIVADATA